MWEHVQSWPTGDNHLSSHDYSDLVSSHFFPQTQLFRCNRRFRFIFSAQGLFWVIKAQWIFVSLSSNTNSLSGELSAVTTSSSVVGERASSFSIASPPSTCSEQRRASSYFRLHVYKVPGLHLAFSDFCKSWTTCLFLLQAHLVAAFEQSLGNMTIRLKSLTLTAEQKVKTSSPCFIIDFANQSAQSELPQLFRHCLCVGLWAERVEEDHRAAEEAERRCSGCHQRGHQHTWTHA